MALHSREQQGLATAHDAGEGHEAPVVDGRFEILEGLLVILGVIVRHWVEAFAETKMLHDAAEHSMDQRGHLNRELRFCITLYTIDAYITRMGRQVANMVRNVRFETKNSSKKYMDISAINTAEKVEYRGFH